MSPWIAEGAWENAQRTIDTLRARISAEEKLREETAQQLVYAEEGKRKAENRADAAELLVREVVHWEEDPTVELDWDNWKTRAAALLDGGTNGDRG